MKTKIRYITFYPTNYLQMSEEQRKVFTEIQLRFMREFTGLEMPNPNKSWECAASNVGESFSKEYAKMFGLAKYFETNPEIGMTVHFYELEN